MHTLPRGTYAPLSPEGSVRLGSGLGSVSVLWLINLFEKSTIYFRPNMQGLCVWQQGAKKVQRQGLVS